MDFFFPATLPARVWNLVPARLKRISVGWKTIFHFLLFVWFCYWAWGVIYGTFLDWPNHADVLGTDGRLYYRAAAAFMEGGNPWAAYTATNNWPPSGPLLIYFFTGPPPTVIAFVPFLLIPEQLFVGGFMALTIVAAIYTLRALKLPLYWLAFPPLIQGIMVANPHVLALAMLLSSWNVVRALAVPMKLYAGFPLAGEFRWKAIAILVVVCGASVVLFWPLWSQYIDLYPQVNAWLTKVTDGGYSAYRTPWLFVVTGLAIGALALVDRKAAGWLCVPALWPATQLFYCTFILPVTARDKSSLWLAVVVCIQGYRRMGLIPWAITAYCVWRVGLVAWHWSREQGARGEPRNLVAVAAAMRGALGRSSVAQGLGQLAAARRRFRIA